jgi:N-methylhydantoinase A
VLKGSRPVYFDEVGDFTDTPIFDRARIDAGAAIDGPAVIEQTDTTVLVPPGASARVDAYRNIVIDVGSAGDARAVTAAGSAKGEAA